ncbi:hypothetical protein SAMD00019534_072800, partial [Acytostelium subglobosum LB1]|uniref:hypothetical protein n=1 Tax=Acytostelium subglobosum LB1 TaxID=1410327 RepID=UPI000644E253
MNIDNEAGIDDMSVETGATAKASVSSNVFDLENYINQYTGFTKIYRLLFIMDTSTELGGEALERVTKEIKCSPNLDLYAQLCSRIPNSKPDTAWVESTHKKNQQQLERIEQELNAAKANMIKESIRVAHNELGDFYHNIGDFTNALKCYVRTRDYCATPKHILAMCFNIIRTGIDMNNYIHVVNYVTKAEQTPDLDQTSIAKLRSAIGLSNLENSKYMISPQDIAVYGGLCALATFDRSELKRKVIDNTVFRNYLELVPEIRELINDFYNSKYSSCLNYLEKLKPTLQLDLHLHDHIDKLYQRIRSKALIQYFSPFSSVDLNVMATAFNTNVASLEKELSKLIMDDSISARIDSHNKRLYARKTDQRSVTFEKSLQVGRDFQTTSNDTLLRLNMLNNNLTSNSGLQRQHRDDTKMMMFGDRPSMNMPSHFFGGGYNH